MRILAWVGIGFWGMVLCSALGAHMQVTHALPDVPIIVLTFVALRREAPVVAAAAFILGYAVGRSALAPDGLHACGLVAVSLGVYLGAGSLASRGTMFFAMCSAAAVTAYQALVLLLMACQEGTLTLGGVSGAAFVPTAIMTFFLALVVHHPMLWLEKRLTQDKREGLAWR